MKPKSSLRSFLALAGSALLLASQAHAIDYWWDNNGDTAGFGTASGTWSSTASLFSTSNTGVVTPTGTQATTSSDQAIFGTDTAGNGLGTGTITVDGNVTVGNMIFGTQTTGTITFNTINGGTITTGNNTVRVNGTGATVIFNADYVGATTQWFGNSTTIYNGNFKNTGTSSIRVNHTLQFGSTATVDFTNGSRGINYVLSAGQTSTIQYSSVNDGLMGAVGNNGDSSSGIFIKDGSATSTLRLAADNTFLGEYRIDAGTLQFARRGGLYNGVDTSWLASKIKVGNTGVLGLNVGGTNQFTTTDVTTLLTNLGGANGTSTTGFAAGSAIGFDTTNAAGGTFTVADLIADSTGTGGGSFGVNKLGTNTLILTNTNTYTGATKVNGGTLRAGAAAGGQVFGNGSAVTLADVSGATLDLNGFNQTIGSLAGGGATGGNVTLGADATLTTGGNNTSTSYAGAISGTGTSGLTKTGNGILALSGDNTYTGATLVSAGTLLVNGSLGNSAVTVNGGAFGGSGTIGSALDLTAGSFHVVDLFDALQVTGTVTLYAGFGVKDLAGLDWGSVANDTYTLIDGTLGAGVFDALNNRINDPYDIGGGRSAYFKEGSLQLVVIPEPRAALLGGLGLLMLLRRRRH